MGALRADRRHCAARSSGSNANSRRAQGAHAALIYFTVIDGAAPAAINRTHLEARAGRAARDSITTFMLEVECIRSAT